MPSFNMQDFPLKQEQLGGTAIPEHAQDGDLLVFDAASGKLASASFMTLLASNLNSDGGTADTPGSDFDIASDFGGAA